MLSTLSVMGQGFLHAMSPINLIMMIAGVAMGIIVGCMPGLSAAMGVALMLPLTFTMQQDTALIVLGAIYCGAIFGGSISAILIHTPGTPASAATAIEGYQMTKRGQAGKALFTACYASFWGGLLSCISLYFFAPLLAELTLKFQSAEYFWLSIFGLTIIAGVAGKSLLKGLMSGALGLLLSTIGSDPGSGMPRFMLGGNSYFYDGINVTCALIGLFSMSQPDPRGAQNYPPDHHPLLDHRQPHRHPARRGRVHRLLPGLQHLQAVLQAQGTVRQGLH